MKTNTVARRAPIYTGGGARAAHITPHQQLSRAVATCMLWENLAYETGNENAKNIAALVPQCKPEFVRDCAIAARNDMKLRHAPLFLAREMARSTPAHRLLVGKLLSEIIKRADELSEFLAIYWKDNPDQPLSKQVKVGLREAINKFNEYQLAKYNRNGAVRLRDVVFLTHPKPKDPDLIARLVNRNYIPALTKGEHTIEHNQADKVEVRGLYVTANPGLATPDTWEVELSKGDADKRASWLRLLAERKLGGLAFIRNLRNMNEAGVDKSALLEYAKVVNTESVLPFRFITAAKQNPTLEDVLEPLMLRAAGERPKLHGRTVAIIDTSGSMGARISAKSEATRLETAAALTVLLREQCEDLRLYATAGVDHNYTHATMAVVPRRGFALAEQFSHEVTTRKIGGGGIFLKQCCDWVFEREGHVDRLIVLTDEQDTDSTKVNPKSANAFGAHSYIVNVASHKNGVGYGKWHHIDGWSEAVLDYIVVAEQL